MKNDKKQKENANEEQIDTKLNQEANVEKVRTKDIKELKTLDDIFKGK